MFLGLGDRVKVKITGVVGTVVAQIFRLNEPTYWWLQPDGRHEGKPLGTISIYDTEVEALPPLAAKSQEEGTDEKEEV